MTKEYGYMKTGEMFSKIKVAKGQKRFKYVDKTKNNNILASTEDVSAKVQVAA